jgi:tripartite-type tricarboxylate transporter receptor subunit TctC
MRSIVAALALTCGLVFPLSAQAQNAASGYPNRPVRVLVPFAPGGVVDVMARLLAPKLSDAFGKQFYVDNQGGAGGNIGTGTVANSPADGYTLLVTSSSFVVNPSLHDKIPYDPIKDFVAVTIAAASPNVLVVHPSVPANNVKELVELIKANPGKYSFASAGTGTTPHLSGELFKLSLKLDLVHVPFQGAGPAFSSAIAGHTPIAFTGLPGAATHIQQGSLRALAITSEKRSQVLPDVPTMAEAGVSGQEAETLLSVLVPAATPKEIVTALHREIVKIVALPETRAKLDSLGFAPVAGTPEQSSARIKEEIAKWGGVIKQANIKSK